MVRKSATETEIRAKTQTVGQSQQLPWWKNSRQRSNQWRSCRGDLGILPRHSKVLAMAGEEPSEMWSSGSGHWKECPFTLIGKEAMRGIWAEEWQCPTCVTKRTFWLLCGGWSDGTKSRGRGFYQETGVVVEGKSWLWLRLGLQQDIQ